MADHACTTVRLKGKENAAVRLLAMRMIEESRAGVQDRASLKAAPLAGRAMHQISVARPLVGEGFTTRASSPHLLDRRRVPFGDLLGTSSMP